MQTPNRSRIFNIQEAAAQAQVLQRLNSAIQASRQRLHAIEAFLPRHLFDNITAGPFLDEQWCLLVPNSSVASKLRQWLPKLIEELQQQELHTTDIRIKVCRTTPHPTSL